MVRGRQYGARCVGLNINDGGHHHNRTWKRKQYNHSFVKTRHLRMSKEKKDWSLLEQSLACLVELLLVF